jgi:hypothetical protein
VSEKEREGDGGTEREMEEQRRRWRNRERDGGTERETEIERETERERD